MRIASKRSFYARRNYKHLPEKQTVSNVTESWFNKLIQPHVVTKGEDASHRTGDMGRGVGRKNLSPEDLNPLTGGLQTSLERF